jgi:hypothetical protein
VRARREFGMTESGTVPQLAQLTQESRWVVSRYPVTSHLSHIRLMVLHPRHLSP